MINFYFYWGTLFTFIGLLFFSLGLFSLSFDYVVLIDWDIVSMNSSSVVMTLLFDWMSMFFIGGVMMISSMVIFYSSSYMSFDMYSVRFLFMVIMFVISMFLMIISPNLISILLGWDGLGLVSYCLVIYFHNYKSFNAGMLTVLTNRIGDVGILVCIGLMLNFGSWYFMYYSLFNTFWGYLFFMLICFSAFTKSAQIPFSSWLPAAMAAPTPVSSLVHSSTLVTAGVYLMIRFSDFLYGFDVNLFLFLSVFTMFMSGLAANYEFDMKKIIALSTLSQLGLMMSILFMGFPVLSFFHLLTHAFFKALLFLCGGLIIHCMNDTQDIRFMGGLINLIPFTCSCFCISNLSLCGLPFLSGFYSKDIILEMMSLSYFNFFIYFIFYVSMGLTVMYSIRMIYYLIFGFINLLCFNNFFEDNIMCLSMIFLVFMGIISGSFIYWLISFFPVLVVLPYDLKLLIIFFIFLGSVLGYFISLISYSSLLFNNNYDYLYFFLCHMWFMPYYSTLIFSSLGLYYSFFNLKFLDSWGEHFFSLLLSYFMIFLSKTNLFFQKNSLKIFLSLFFFYSLFIYFL
uniref:NADH-ubiquinone oxidoreductase chain 5 n=1 Tax=Crompus oculatus TaxID=2813432 RepID=A0A8T9ZWS1_9HEMI|nr:NADH dehydrogenase subunit 5 [Crompus oculatus]